MASKPGSDPPGAARETLLRRSLLLPERPSFGRFTLRPFSLWTLDLCEEIGLDVFLALPPEVIPAGGRSFQLAALVWFHSVERSEAEVDAALMSGAWRSEVKRSLRDPDLAAALPALADYLAYFGQMIAAASVRVRKKPKAAGEVEEKPPPGLVEPGGAYALLWTLGGGALDGPDQFAWLYRGLPLPRLLSFYHCALRASLAWTLPARGGAAPVRPRLAAVRAAIAEGAAAAASRPVRI